MWERGGLARTGEEWRTLNRKAFCVFLFRLVSALCRDHDAVSRPKPPRASRLGKRAILRTAN
jgi:hypothetical protein